MSLLGLALVMAMMLGIAAYLIGALVMSIRREEKAETLRGAWKHFGLSIAFCTLFFFSWVGHGIAQWQSYVDEQRTHNDPVEVIDYLQEFSQATLENWQSEFLQLFSFTVLAALLIHKGSAESRDSDDEMQKALNRIENELNELKQRV